MAALGEGLQPGTSLLVLKACDHPTILLLARQDLPSFLSAVMEPRSTNSSRESPRAAALIF